MARRFVAGLELSRRFYRQAVEPLLDQHPPGLPHTAALIGAGSEVLGFDTDRSTDHDWGPRVQLFLRPEDLREHREKIDNLLAERLPATFCGYPSNLAPVGEHGTRHMRRTRGDRCIVSTSDGEPPARCARASLRPSGSDHYVSKTLCRRSRR